MQKKTFYLTSACCLLILSAANIRADAEPKNSPAVYKLPNEVTCKNNYCVDIENNPITGTVRRYKNGYLIREYIAQDGYLDGISKAYYENGNTKTERSYKKGVLDGTVAEYDKDGQITGNITYKNGKKEGVTSYYDENNIVKVIYIDDNMNGDAQIWDKKQGKLIYKLKMQDNQILEGTYVYAKNQQTEEVELNKLIIEGNNKQCLQLQKTFSKSSCQVDLDYTISVLSSKGTLSEECNIDWYKQNKSELIKYIKSCKCNDLKEEIKVIYEDENREASEKRELLLTLKEKYENHCMEKKE